MTKKLISALLLLTISLTAVAQDEDVQYPINAATLIGVGGYNILDTYITPSSRIPYKGWGLQVLNERMKITKLANHKISRQQIFNVNFASTENGAGTSCIFSGLIDYSLGYHYRFNPIKNLKLLGGASLHAMGGFIYGTRVSNNPASGKLDLDLNFSGIAIYDFLIRNYPLTVRYQFEVPFMGVLFSPHYGQSYYEIFNQGNTSGIFPFTSFHNKQCMKNYLTMDFPVGRFTIRAGYLNNLYHLNVNGIKSHLISHSFVIGLVKEITVTSGRKVYKKSKRSAYY